MRLGVSGVSGVSPIHRARVNPINIHYPRPGGTNPENPANPYGSPGVLVNVGANLIKPEVGGAGRGHGRTVSNRKVGRLRNADLLTFVYVAANVFVQRYAPARLLVSEALAGLGSLLIKPKFRTLRRPVRARTRSLDGWLRFLQVANSCNQWTPSGHLKKRARGAVA
jgi:hypothetical protein